MMGSMLRVLTLALLAACTASSSDVAPPQFDFYFPAALSLSPDEHWLFVTSANSDIRFSSGTLQVVDLDAVDQIAAGQAQADCAAIPGRPTVQACPSTKPAGGPEPYMVANASVMIGNFGVTSAVEALTVGGQPSDKVRVFMTVRGDPSLTYADFDPATGTTDCGATGTYPNCDQSHRLAILRNDNTNPTLAPEPFGLFVDGIGEHAFVTHLSTGQVTLARAPRDASQAPVLEDSLPNLWAANIDTGLIGAVGVATRMPGDVNGFTYITSRQEARIAMVRVVDGPTGEDGQPIEKLVAAASFFYSGLAAGSGIPGDARSLLFSPDGNRAYFVSRLPVSLQMVDSSLDPFGIPVNTFMAATELCEAPAALAYADFGEGPRIVVPCFGSGQVWVFDADTLQLIDTEDVGKGPTSVVLSPKHQKIYVTNYAEDTIQVIDASPGTLTQYRSILRLGRLRPPEFK
jgi:DNA-binding beta-propeller fold protein YncE